MVREWISRMKNLVVCCEEVYGKEVLSSMFIFVSLKQTLNTRALPVQNNWIAV
jgi:hypothetical protein